MADALQVEMGAAVIPYFLLGTIAVCAGEDSKTLTCLHGRQKFNDLQFSKKSHKSIGFVKYNSV